MYSNSKTKFPMNLVQYTREEAKSTLDWIKKLFRNKDKKALINLATLFCVGVLLLVLSGTLFAKKKNNPNPTGAVTGNGIFSTSTNGSHNSGLTSNMAVLGEFDVSNYTLMLEQKLQDTLSLVDGAGKVKVMLSISLDRSTEVAKDSTSSQDSNSQTDSQGGKKEDSSKKLDEKTVIIKNADGSETPLVLKEFEPKVDGVLIISEGGGDIVIKDALIRATQSLLGVDAYRISVLKMKKP